MRKRKLLLAVLLIFTINVASVRGVQLPTKVTAATTMRLNQNVKQSNKKLTKLKKRAKKWSTYRFKKQKVILKVRPVRKKFIYDSWATNLNLFKFSANIVDVYLWSKIICFDIEGGLDYSKYAYQSTDVDELEDLEFKEFYVYYGYVVRNSKGKVVDKLKFKETRNYMRNYEIEVLGLSDYGICSESFSRAIDTMCHVGKSKKWRTFYVEPIVYFMDDEEYGCIWEFL